MKSSLHPEYHEIVARCACGTSFKTRSTRSDIHATICSHCHPYYTGDQKLVDTAGRIEKFEKKFKNTYKKM